MKHHKEKSGFTTIEVMIAAGVFALLSVAVTQFYVQTLKAANYSEQQVRLVTTMRSFTNEVLFNASRAHEIVLYNSSSITDRADATSRREITIDPDTEALLHPTGNFVVFVYYELPKPSTQPRYRIAKLVGYDLVQSGTTPGVLSRITIDLTSTPSTNTVEEIMNANWATAPRRTYTNMVMPLALSDAAVSTTTPQMFYKRSDQNLAICGQLLKSTANLDSQDRRTVTRTMFFTVTTRT